MGVGWERESVDEKNKHEPRTVLWNFADSPQSGFSDCFPVKVVSLVPAVLRQYSPSQTTNKQTKTNNKQKPKSRNKQTNNIQANKNKINTSELIQ